MTKTKNYQLNQWDAADPIRREDFNRDNAALDAAVKAAMERGVQFITGSYTGTGVAEKREFSLGAKPKLVLLCGAFEGSGTYFYQSILVTDLFVYCIMDGGKSKATIPGLVALTDDGFIMSDHESNINYGFNRADKLYYYLVLC